MASRGSGRSARRGVAVAVLVAAALVPVAPGAPAAAASPPRPMPDGGVAARLPVTDLPGPQFRSGALTRLVADLLAGPVPAPVSTPVAVEVVHDGDHRAVELLVAGLGGRVTGGLPGRIVQALVPLGRLGRLEGAASVELVRPPLAVGAEDHGTFPTVAAAEPPGAALDAASSSDDVGSVAGAQLSVTNALAWHAANRTGQGVKVGIIDVFGATRWQQAQAAGDVPAPAGTFCLTAGFPCALFGGASDTHGNAVAEVLHDMAPDAQLYLARGSTASDYRAIVDWFAANGVQIVSRSQSFVLDGPGDGTGDVASVIDAAAARGMVWFNSAGNRAGGADALGVVRPGSYWRGPWRDTDGDGLLEFTAAGVEELAMSCTGSVLGLRWDDFDNAPGDVTDYQLELFDASGRSLVVDNRQTRGAAPLEVPFDSSCASGQSVQYARVRRVAATANDAVKTDTIELVGNARSFFTAWQTPYTAASPAVDSANPSMMAVGAVDPAGGAVIGWYSNQGPTNATRASPSRIKPDIVGAACLATLTSRLDGSGCFNGTSASTPVAAGAAALVLGAGLVGEPRALPAWIRANAVVDRGAPGLDNVYGAGEVVLPDPAQVTPPPTTAPPTTAPTTAPTTPPTTAPTTPPTTSPPTAPPTTGAVATTAPAQSTGDPVPPGATRFVPLDRPTRFLDTRLGIGARAGLVPAGGTVELDVAGRGGVPLGATAVVMNVTATETGSASFVTAWPTGLPRPTTSNVNPERAGQTLANLVTVPIGSAGRVSLFTSGATHLLADVAGYFVPVDGPVAAGRLVTLPAARRVLDTRSGLGAPAGRTPAGGTTAVPVAAAGVPADATAVVMNVTVTEAEGAGYVTAVPGGAVRPDASNLNHIAGQTVANQVVVALGAAGTVGLFTFASTHLVVDVAGWYTGAAAPPGVGGLFVPIAPVRILDTRIGPPVAANEVVVPSGWPLGSRPPSASSALTVNLTITQTQGAGYVTAFVEPPPPLASQVNADRPGQTIANHAIVRYDGATGVVRLVPSVALHLVVDAVGWYR